MGSRAAASWANHCATTKATTQPASDKNSYTNPRQAPISMDASSRATNIQSRAAMRASQLQDGHRQVQRLDLCGGLVGLGTALERPHANPDALAVGRLHHLGVGLDARTLQFEAHLAGLVSLGVGTDLGDETPLV